MEKAILACPIFCACQERRSRKAMRVSMYLHNNPTALPLPGNTLADPKFTDGGTLKTSDYVVANPPFSYKRWTTGVNLEKDPFERFTPFGTPPAKQGDYA